MLDDLFQSDNLAAARDAAMRPPPVPKQAASFSAWNTLTAAPRGAAAGAAQTGGFFSDVLGAFGQALDAMGTAGAGGMFAGQTQAERQSSEAAAAKMRREGLDFNSEAGDSFRSVARGYAPDPETAHVAERLVFDFARFATKAVGYSAAAGPVVGAGLTGADEALAASDDLRLQGVDLGTRSAAAAVIGAASALGVGLPMAGRTALGTTGLVALGGPGAFVAQQAGVRKILQDADYSKLAEQYDPFDPVGLAVSTLVPAGFGAWAMRGAKARARAAEVKPAEPMAEPMKPADAPRAEVSPEVQDAARVVLADMERARSNSVGDDIRSHAEHEAALTKAEEQIAAGERVSVADLAPKLADTSAVDLPSAAARQIAEAIQRAKNEDPFAEYALRVIPGEFDGEIRQGDVLPPSRQWVDGQMTDEELIGTSAAKIEGDSPESVLAAIKLLGAHGSSGPNGYYFGNRVVLIKGERAAYGEDVGEVLISDPEVVGVWKKRGMGKEPITPNESPSPSPLGEFSARIAEAAALVKAEIEAQQNSRDSAARPATEATTQPQAADAGSPAAQAQADAQAAGSAAPKAGLVDDGAAMRVAEIEAAQPDMLVQLDGMDAPKPLSEVMAAVKAEADDLIADGDLMQQAAVCALLNGQ